MNSAQFDRWSQTLSRAASRRQTLLALLLGTANLHDTNGVIAGPGCKNVGKKCKKKKDCCSGVCKGKKGRKKCKAHDTGGCLAGQGEFDCGEDPEFIPCTTSNDEEGVCSTTTGNAGYCGRGFGCFPCTSDADCRRFCGSDAACIRCEGFCENSDLTACVGQRECVGLPD